MSKETKKQAQTNILYDYYRFCNGQEDCRECPLCFIVEDIYGYYEALHNQSEELSEETKELLYDEIYDEFTEILKNNKYKCLKDFNKEELEYAIKEIKEWCEINPEYYLKDSFISAISNPETTYPSRCPYDYKILNKYGCLKQNFKETMNDSPNELMNSINCNRKEKGYNINCEECKQCWDTPLRYEEEI